MRRTGTVGRLFGHAAEPCVQLHRGEEVVGGGDAHGASFGVNHLTLDALDAQSRQPELKHAAVRIEPARLAWHYCVFGRVGATRWLRLQRSLRAHFPAFDYCACVPLWCGDDEDGALLLRAASLRSADPSRLQAIEMEFGLAEPDTLRYDDSRRSLQRRLRIRGSQLMGAPWPRTAADALMQSLT
jgi:assimilatory nitrate reductase catalytic subunit